MATQFLKEAKGFLEDAGYRSTDVVEDYRFTVCTEQGDLRGETASLVAFGSQQRNMRTACVAAFESDNLDSTVAPLRNLRFLATPAAIVGVKETVTLYAISHQADAQILDQHDRREWRTRLRHRLEYLDPRNLIAAKRGVRESGLFDARLFAWAEDITERTLSRLLEEMFSTLLNALSGGQRRSLERQQAILQLLFRLLAARVLEDMGRIERMDTAQDAIEAVSQALSIASDDKLSDVLSGEVVSRIMLAMRERFSFDSLTPETLAYAYENALVSNQSRHDLGIYYTPRAIARYVLEHLPLESIPQARRLLLDPCCGSGSFLLAGHERLNGMLPEEWGPARRHKYLAERLVGQDVDPFARESARLALLLAGLDVGDGWVIVAGDATQDISAALSRPPSVIVTNPPFKEIKEGGVRREVAAEIIVNILRHLPADGYLGVVVPQSLLESSSAVGVRGEILKTCALLEIATFPGSLFESNADTAVLLARKEGSGKLSRDRSVVTIRECHGRDVAAFQRFQKFSSTYSVSVAAWQEDKSARFIASPFFDLWARLQKTCKTLDDVAWVENGLQVKTNDLTSASTERRPGDVAYVDRVGAAIVPFAFIADGKIASPKYLTYGDQLHRTRREENFREPKVLISSNRNPAYSWRFVAAIAPPNLYYSDNFHGLRPRNNATTLYELTAVLNSHVANAWFHSNCRKRKIVLRILKRLPFPSFDAAQREQLDEKVRRLSDLAKRASGQKASVGAASLLLWDTGSESTRLESIREEAVLLLGEVDAIVFDAYGITETERLALGKWMGMDRRPMAF